MKQGNIRVHSKDNIFEVKCREEEGKLFGVTKGISQYFGCVGL